MRHLVSDLPRRLSLRSYMLDCSVLLNVVLYLRGSTLVLPPNTLRSQLRLIRINKVGIWTFRLELLSVGLKVRKMPDLCVEHWTQFWAVQFAIVS